MKVIFDCTALNGWVGNPTGIQRVIGELGKSLSEEMPETITAIFNSDGSCYQYCIDSRAIGSQIFLQCGDMIFASGHDWDHPEHFKNICKYAEDGVFLSVLIYDIIPIKFPFTYTQEFFNRFENWLDKAIGIADSIFSISSSTKKDIEFYAKNKNISIPDVQVLRIGDDLPINTGSVSNDIVNKISTDYILSVGTIEYRKNHIVLLNAYRYMIHNLDMRLPKLYIVGRQGLYDSHIRLQVEGDPVLRGKVEILSGLNDTDLRYLYISALFTIYPSIYEGWGLPVSESLYYGVPCITSSSSSMLEIAPTLTPFADPFMTNEWVEKIREWIDYPLRLEVARENIRKHYRKVSWYDSACFLRDCLNDFSRKKS
ncbi:glycosyltransferase family 4 protein [Dickeya chrysanthemi]|uniref:glycosyltransferase family 4 protein n=1 Tax=Dickeya chrysanthemi TaxID=556 RepID=UPI0009DE76A3|nr:glycosyltransferase family 1 protein [Dickeya chrysanthemi]